MTIPTLWTDPVQAESVGFTRDDTAMQQLLETLDVERQDRTFWRLPTTAYQQAAEDRALAFANLTETEAVGVRVAELLDAVGAELHEIEVA